MAKLPLAWASLLLVLTSTSCGLPPTPPSSPSSGPSASPRPSATPDATPPMITSQQPAADGVLDASGVDVTFNEPVTGVDRASFQLADADGSVVPAAVSLDADGQAATLVPTAPLTFAAPYTVTLNGLVRDLAGNRLARTVWVVATSNVVTLQPGTYTGYRFGNSTAHLTGIKRSTLVASSTTTASDYRVMGDAGYLLVDGGIWQGYWIHGSSDGSGQDDLAAPIPPLPACDYVDLPTARAGYGEWGSTVLDTVFQLPAGYAPGDLVDTSRAGLNGSFYVRGIALADLTAMVTAAKADGARLAIQSAYRSYRGQVLTFNGWVRQVGYNVALTTSARPGHSEHQLGTAIDFKTAGGASPWTYADWATTTEGAWLKANAWKYGWLLSYPKGTTAVSCYRYEPWHYRYVGRTTAAAVHAADVTLREWLWAQGYGVR